MIACMSGTALHALDEALQHAGAPWTGTGAHGVAAGWLAGGSCPTNNALAVELLDRPCDGDRAAESLAEALDAVIEATQRSLRDPLLGFTPWLPPDEAPLEERVRALAEWAEGFGVGFSLGTRDLSGPLPEPVREVLRDLAEISRAAAPEEQDDEGEETAFAELYEYLRMAVLLVREEMHTLREARR